jgi:hypothetical protein
MAPGKRASYDAGIAYIAFLDDPFNRDANDMKTYPTVRMLAYMYDVPAVDVADAVVAYRKRHRIA